jgi:hypothetical protein
LCLQADIQDVKNAVGSAVDIMQTIGSSICSLLAKVMCALNCFPVPFSLSLVACHNYILIYGRGPYKRTCTSIIRLDNGWLGRDLSQPIP